jgi:hypothetical protein
VSMSGQYLRVILRMMRMMCMQCEYEWAVAVGHPALSERVERGGVCTVCTQCIV